MLNLKLKCKKHPKYEGKLAPRVKGGCRACEALYAQAAYARDLSARPHALLEIEVG